MSQLLKTPNNSEIDLEDIKEDEHVLHLWEPLSFTIDEDFEYIHKGFFFSIFSNLLYGIAFPLLWLINKFAFGFRIKGRENYDKVKGGKITVSNHVHVMDCTMVGLSNFPDKTFYISLASNFKIPVVRTIIKLLNAIPIPEKYCCKKYFKAAINDLLEDNGCVHIYPESSLWPYYTKLRNFKDGAFAFAVDNHVPIVPLVFSFYEPTGFYKLYKKKPCVQLEVLDPVYPNNNLPRGEAIQQLKDKIHHQMEEKINTSK